MALTPDAWQTFLKLDAKNKKETGTNGREAATAAKLRRVDAGAKKKEPPGSRRRSADWLEINARVTTMISRLGNKRAGGPAEAWTEKEEIRFRKSQLQNEAPLRSCSTD